MSGEKPKKGVISGFVSSVLEFFRLSHQETTTTLAQPIYEELNAQGDEADQRAEEVRLARDRVRQRLEALQAELKERDEVDAGKFLAQSLHAAFPLSMLHHDNKHVIEDGNEQVAAPSSSTPAESTTVSGREFEHYFPIEVRMWSSFDVEMEKLKTFATDKIVKRPVEQEPDETIVFYSDKTFNAYWINPRSATMRVMHELFPSSHYRKGRFTDCKKGPGKPDECFWIFDDGIDKQPMNIVTLAHKHPGVTFETDQSIPQIVAAGEPAVLDNKTAKQCTLCTLTQTFTYQLHNKCKYGCFSNWEFWMFTMRQIQNGREILYVSKWIKRDQARLAYATLLHLACNDLHATESKFTGSTGLVPQWIKTKPRDQQEQNPAPSSGDQQNSGGIAETTTLTALGVTSLTLLDDFKVLGHTEKSHTRRLTVNGRDIVAKLVDFHGVPKHSDFSERDLYDLEMNEVRIYDHLREVQGKLIPTFLYHGMDFNSIWATAVTTYEGEPLSKMKITSEIRAAAVASLREIHALGVLHGDIALRNAVWNNKRVVWVDLELSSLRGEGSTHFDQEAAREVKDLLELLGPEPQPEVRRERKRLTCISKVCPCVCT